MIQSGTWPCATGPCSVWTQVNNDLRNTGLALEVNPEADDVTLADKFIAVGGTIWKVSTALP